MTRPANDAGPTGPVLPTAGGGERRPGLPLRRVLELDVLAGATVLAGQAGLDRVVSRVNVMEVPDVLPYVRVGELLLTTGYALREDPGLLAGLVRELHARDVAALAIKLGRYVDELPASVLAVATELGFPVVGLPDTASYDELLTAVLTAVLDHQADRLTRSEEAHRALVQVVLDGGGPAEVALALSRILGAAVLVSDVDGRALAEAGTDPAELALARARPAGAAVVAVVAGRQDHGAILAFSTRRALGDLDVQVLERAATVCALALAKQQAVSAVESRYQADFLRDLLLGRAGDATRTVPHARGLGWRLDRPLVVVVVEPVDAGADQRPRVERLAASWAAATRARDTGAAVVGFSTEVVALLGLPPDGDVERRVREVATTVRGDTQRGAFVVGISRVCPQVGGVPAAYEQARRAVRIGRQVDGDTAVTSFDRLGVHRILGLVPDPAELRAFERETLRGLADDTPEAVDLRTTLQVLLDTNLNVAVAARELHFHYNTLRYRIAKLERLLGPFTTDPHLRLDLALALRVAQMRGLAP